MYFDMQNWFRINKIITFLSITGRRPVMDLWTYDGPFQNIGIQKKCEGDTSYPILPYVRKVE